MNEEYKNNPDGVKIEGFPEFITLLNDGNYKIEMRQIEGIKNKFDYFILEDIPSRKFNQLCDRSKNSKGEIQQDKLDELLIQNAILYPEIKENDIEELKTSEMFRLRKAINIIYDIESFL